MCFMLRWLQVGESAGPECKAALQEVTALVDEQLVSNAEAVKNLFGAAKVCVFVFIFYNIMVLS